MNDILSGGPTGDVPSAPEEHADGDLHARALAALQFLQAANERPGLLTELDPDLRARLLLAAGEVACPDPQAKREFARALRKRRRLARRDQDERVLASSAIRVQRAVPLFLTPAPLKAPLPAGADIDRALQQEPASAAPDARNVGRERSCYVCKRGFTRLHFFYDSLCTSCGDLNWAKRQQSADLHGRVALVTGARVKIGYQASIMLLRAGAAVIATTRFPHDAADRYAAEPDFGVWGQRLQIYGLDLRHTPSVEAFAQHLCESSARLDFVLNNACQTVRRPSGFYAHLLAAERSAPSRLPLPARHVLAAYHALRASEPTEGALAMASVRNTGPASAIAGLHDPAGLSQLALTEEDLRRGEQLFPAGALDADRQQVDLRGRNSWRLPLSDVSASELLEVQLVNAVAPFLLNARLKPLMLRVPSRDKHIVNVSAMEGQFYRSFKTDKHPHTNMAKAALNMMTRTSAADYVRDGIHMNSVDTGWVTDEDPIEIATRKTREQGFHPPLDIVDGAARICDPIFCGMQTGQHVWGQFLKDYAPTDW